jgi:hypothetical protein
MSDEKQIIYILIAEKRKPLASYSKFTGEFIQTCEAYLQEVKQDSSAAINFGTFIIYYLNQDNITYLLMTSSIYPKATAIGCIESLRKEFANILGGRNFDTVPDYGLNDQLKEKLKMKFDYFNENTEVSSETLEKLKNELGKMKDEIFKANEELMKRNEKLVEMENKAQDLESSSKAYKQGAIKVRKSESKKKCYVIMGTIVAILIIVYLIICMACGNFRFDC